jgi:predicted dehydrogenase
MAIRIVVVGLGPRGQDWLREIQKASKYVIVACVDVDPAALREVCSKGVVTSKQCFTQLAEALDQNECDAVMVATAPGSHFEPCKLALSRGLAVMVEKPFTLRLCEAVELVTLAEQKRVVLIVTQNYRYMRAFRTARGLIANGALGQVGMAVCQYYRVPHAMGSLAHLTNNVLWGAGIHHIDSLSYTLNKRVTGVLAENFTMPYGKLPRGASMQMLLSLENETHAIYSSTYESSGHEFFERGQEFYLRYVGERATLHVFQRWLILCESGKLPRLVRRGARKLTEERILLDQLERALVAGEEPECSGRDNLQTMAVVEACVRSASERRWINPQELLDEYR